MSYVISRRGEKGPETLTRIDPNGSPTVTERITHRHGADHPPSRSGSPTVNASGPVRTVERPRRPASHGEPDEGVSPTVTPNGWLYTMISASCNGGRIRFPTMRTSPASSSRRSTFQARETSTLRLLCTDVG